MSLTATGLLAVAAGGALGGMARAAVSGAVARGLGERFPWGTLTVNLTGSFLIGLLAGAMSGGAEAATLWALLATGLLGSYTTVSSFSLQTLALMQAGDWPRAGANVAVSLGGCIGAAAAGWQAARALGLS